METIVALVLFSSVVVALYGGLIGAGRSIRLADQEAAATAVAVARLASAGVETPLAEGQEFTGENKGLRWRMTVERMVRPDDPPLQSKLLAYWVTVDVTWGDGPATAARRVQMRTLKLGLKP